MIDGLTMACINLHSVLRNLEDLCELDDDAKELIKGKNITILFSAKGVPEATLSFKDGKCIMQKGKHQPYDMKLYFTSADHFNKMIEGKANPIPVKGLSKINFLKNEFISLTNRLEYYLKPTEEQLKDPDYSKINTILTAYTAFFALSEIGNNDKIGKLNASRIPDGTIAISVLNGGPTISLIASGGKLTTKKGLETNARANMSFDCLETANGILNGSIDSYTCIGDGRLSIKGYIPMVDNMNKLLAQVPAYLK
ncbi:MAG: hypothetical protein GX947_03365 [Tissierellia bacterium]|nr:hypothetical protein [Tissierellia bacterium]